MILEFSKTADQSLQNKINRSIIFNYLKNHGPASRAKISRELNISASAVSRVVDGLIREKYVIETEKIKTAVGKRPIQLEINSQRGYVIGLDLSQDRVQIALSDLTGKVLDKYQGFEILGKKNEAKKLIGEIQSFLKEYVNNNGIEDDFSLAGICIGLPADIDMETSKVSSASLYEEWTDIDFKEILEKEFNIPVYVEKDVILSVLAEKNYGEGKNYKDVVFVEITRGVSAGIIIDNKLIRGSTGSAGQIAFTVIDSNNLSHNFKDKGYLDKFASVQSIKERVIAEIRKGNKSSIINMVNNDIEKIEPFLVCKAAIEGDYLANEIIKDIVRLLSIGIINLILVVNPEVVVVGGNLTNLPAVRELFINNIVDIVKSSIPFRIPEFKLSSLGNEAVLTGASSLAVEALLAGEFPYKIGQ